MLHDDYDRAIHYCQLSVPHAKRLIGGEAKTRRVFDALSSLSDVHQILDNLTEAKAGREAAYNYVSEIYDPENPLVLVAASKLIENLSKTEDHYDAERFARICYGSLTRPPIDPESREAAAAAAQLAQTCHDHIEAIGPDSADIEEAEMLARKAVEIMKKFRDPVSKEMMAGVKALADIKLLQNDFGDEIKNLLEDCLSDAIRFKGLDSGATAIANDYLGPFHLQIVTTLPSSDAKRKHPQLSESHFKESLRTITEEFGPNHRTSMRAVLQLSIVSKELEHLEGHMLLEGL
jgi:hypothetical protein